MCCRSTYETDFFPIWTDNGNKGVSWKRLLICQVWREKNKICCFVCVIMFHFYVILLAWASAATFKAVPICSLKTRMFIGTLKSDHQSFYLERWVSVKADLFLWISWMESLLFNKVKVLWSITWICFYILQIFNPWKCSTCYCFS